MRANGNLICCNVRLTYPEGIPLGRSLALLVFYEEVLNAKW